MLGMIEMTEIRSKWYSTSIEKWDIKNAKYLEVLSPLLCAFERRVLTTIPLPRPPCLLRWYYMKVRKTADQLEPALDSFPGLHLCERFTNVDHGKVTVIYFWICSRVHVWTVKNCKAGYISSRLAGYWEKFSISNNRASDEPHWLR